MLHTGDSGNPSKGLRSDFQPLLSLVYEGGCALPSGHALNNGGTLLSLCCSILAIVPPNLHSIGLLIQQVDEFKG